MAGRGGRTVADVGHLVHALELAAYPVVDTLHKSNVRL